ncbi:leucine-rich repeat protein [Vermiculatibacterium agrestimuris]|uniref:leucine-rich repeat protein n=1 Tax=Vermiculatibacterium agrestimuris TaxID=2941519 RepID=UPI00203B6CB9|nr:leucine-rich repeat protein [Vermiculatibacterium agrestimuris]
MKKHILSLILALGILVTAMAVPASAADNEFDIRDGLLLKYNGSGGDIVIPDDVTGIADSAFEGCENLTYITIPSSVQAIGEAAFRGCRSLKTIIIPEGVTTICDQTFDGCSSLTSVTIPSSVTEIQGGSSYSGAFMGCINLTSISLPDGLTSIEENAFGGCTGLTSITIPGGVTAIRSGTFSGCSGLEQVYIPEGVTYIAQQAFKDCVKLDNVVIPDTVTKIGGSAFQGCSSLENVTLPSSLTDIGDYAFYETPWAEKNQEAQGDFKIVGGNLTAYSGTSESVNIPKGVTQISPWAFRDHTELKYVTIPEGVTVIGHSAFEGCENLISVTIPDSVIAIGLTSVANPLGTNAFYYYVGDYTYGFSQKLPPQLTLHVGAGSYAEEHAKKYNLPYVLNLPEAIPNRSTVIVDGKEIAFDAYTINENNYFKLRDLAMGLTGSSKQFEVTWDGANNAINLVSGQSYTVVGGELTPGDGTNKTAVQNSSIIYLNGQPIQLAAYTINNNNYFKLRDVGQTFGFDVSWDGSNNTIVVDTNHSYTPD